MCPSPQMAMTEPHQEQAGDYIPARGNILSKLHATPQPGEHEKKKIKIMRKDHKKAELRNPGKIKAGRVNGETFLHPCSCVRT